MIRRPPRSTLFPLHDALPIWKAFRNEINPRNFIFRSREFEQMELEYFCAPEQGMQLLDYWLEERLKFYDNRSEEHTSELQSRQYLVCRLLLEKNKNIRDRRVR